MDFHEAINAGVLLFLNISILDVILLHTFYTLYLCIHESMIIN